MKYYNTTTDLSFVLTDKSDFRIKPHNHVSKYVVGLVLNGSLNIFENDKTKRCNRDDIFIISIYVAHSIELIDENTKFLSMCVGENFIKEYMKHCEKEQLIKYTDKLCEQGIITEENANAFLDAMEIIVELYQSLELKSKLGMEQISESIVNQPERDLKLDDLANAVYVSKYYLIRKFKEEIGLPPHSFHIQNRVRKAQRLLAEKKCIADVAAEVGFYDQSHFIKAFKSVVGITPSEYINSLDLLDE